MSTRAWGAWDIKNQDGLTWGEWILAWNQAGNITDLPHLVEHKRLQQAWRMGENPKTYKG